MPLRETGGSAAANAGVGGGGVGASISLSGSGGTSPASAFLSTSEGVLDNRTLAMVFPQPGNCYVATFESGLQIDFTPAPRFRLWETTAQSHGPEGGNPLLEGSQPCAYHRRVVR